MCADRSRRFTDPREFIERDRRMCTNQFMCLKEGNGGPFRERHSTCKHMELMSHHQTLKGNISIFQKKKKKKVKEIKKKKKKIKKIGD